MDHSKQIITNIRKAREKAELTQFYIATKLGISQNAYSKIELGHTELTVNRLYDIAQLLQTTPGLLMMPEVDGIAFKPSQHHEN